MNFKIGDIVRVQKQTEDDSICTHLLGILIEIRKNNVCLVNIPVLNEIRFYDYGELEVSDV
jgi:hypothetical protein